MHDLVFSISVLCLVILLLIFLLKRFHQPYLIACMLAQKTGIIDGDMFKGAVAVIVLSLLLSTPLAIASRKLVERVINISHTKKASIWQ